MSGPPAEIDEFVAAARDAFGDQLVSVVLYGSAAEGALRATSDVNVLVVLRASAHKRAHGGRVPRWPRLLGVVRAVTRRARIPAKSGSKRPGEGQGGRHGRQE
jgi:predicted nucleotidyltransferase